MKEKEKEKVKEKDKDKKDKKLTKVPSTVTSGVPFEEIFTLGGKLINALITISHQFMFCNMYFC